MICDSIKKTAQSLAPFALSLLNLRTRILRLSIKSLDFKEKWSIWRCESVAWISCITSASSPYMRQMHYGCPFPQIDGTEKYKPCPIYERLPMLWLATRRCGRSGMVILEDDLRWLVLAVFRLALTSLFGISKKNNSLSILETLDRGICVSLFSGLAGTAKCWSSQYLYGSIISGPTPMSRIVQALAPPSHFLEN